MNHLLSLKTTTAPVPLLTSSLLQARATAISLLRARATANRGGHHHHLFSVTHFILLFLSSIVNNAIDYDCGTLTYQAFTVTVFILEYKDGDLIWCCWIHDGSPSLPIFMT
ncbi:hypothetical protein RIF29_35203 [Crotalaria pallida]|uniref:Uncharacterized protein n=1 Tax=Crotalaria pallida TaxID=3830 RepID=A0AAN9E9X6_CROPI